MVDLSANTSHSSLDDVLTMVWSDMVVVMTATSVMNQFPLKTQLLITATRN